MSTGYVERKGGIVWVVPPLTSSSEIIEGILAELEAHLDRDARYALVFDLSETAMPNALQRQRLARHVRENTSKIRRVVRGVAVIMASPLARGVVTAIFWLASPPVPYRMFPTRAEATAWADSLAESEARP